MNTDSIPYHQRKADLICTQCGDRYTAHPNQKYCSLKCRDRAARYRRRSRVNPILDKPLRVEFNPHQFESSPQSYFEYVVDNPTLEQLNATLQDISLKQYKRDVKIVGPIPTGYTVPPDVHFEPDSDYSIAYHDSINPK